jgi:hypothetical protein
MYRTAIGWMLGGLLILWIILLIYSFLWKESTAIQVTRLHELIDKVSTSYDKFFFGDAAREMYDFFWGDFADW